MRNTKQAFTLVELIVVITILAILGTIAFISLQGYSADARNSKRVNDLGNLADSVNIKSTQGTSLLSFITDDATVDVTWVQVAGTGVTATEYNAGKPNYIALGVKSEDFKDPNGDEYRIAATTKKDGQFEFAASMENGAGESTAKIVGNYNARDTTAAYQATILSWTGTSTIKIDETHIGRIMRGDTVNDGTLDLLVTKVSTNGATIDLNGTTNAAATTLTLSSAESDGLIGSAAAAATPVTNDSTDVPY